MTSEQSALARRRLSLGITNVGFWVLSAFAGLGWLVGNTDGQSSNLPLWLAVGLVLAIVSVQAVFDFVGGFALIPTRHPQPWKSLRRWVWGILAHSLVLAGVGLVGLMSLQWTGGFCVGLALSTVALAFGRGLLHRMITGASMREVTLEGRETLWPLPSKTPPSPAAFWAWVARRKASCPCVGSKHCPLRNGPLNCADDDGKSHRPCRSVRSYWFFFGICWDPISVHWPSISPIDRRA